jgi:hypothetical protein
MHPSTRLFEQPDTVVLFQLPIIAKILQDETWLEGERRRQAVSPRDPVVVENVCRVVLRVGQELRVRFTTVAMGTRSLSDRC